MNARVCVCECVCSRRVVGGGITQRCIRIHVWGDRSKAKRPEAVGGRQKPLGQNSVRECVQWMRVLVKIVWVLFFIFFSSVRPSDRRK